MIKQEGRFIATVGSFALFKSPSKGTLGLKVQFNIKEPSETVYWDAWLTSNTQERVVENLIDTGLLETENFDDLAKGVGLSKTQEVEVVIVKESNDGKDYYKVNYVNPIGGKQIKGALAQDEAIIALKGLNLNDTIKLAAKKLNKNPSPAPGYAPSEIPF